MVKYFLTSMKVFKHVLLKPLS